MANKLPGTGTTNTPGDPLNPPLPPYDPEKVLEIQLLNEAVLTQFTPTPDPIAPFGQATLAWDVTMPTTVLPGVHVEVHLHGVGDQVGDQVVNPQGHESVMPYADNTYAITLRTPLAVRELGTVDLAVDLGTCTPVDTSPAVIKDLITGPVKDAFPPGGQVTRRSDPSVDVGINSFVVTVALTASVPDWFDADIDMSLGFEVISSEAIEVIDAIDVIHSFASTHVSFGAASAILSGGCSAAVATALEAMSDGYLSGFVGPVSAGMMKDALVQNITQNRDRLNALHPPVPYRYYDLTLTQDGMTYRFCPAYAPVGGGSPPINTQ
jgi:hypothetical protein